MDGTRDRKRSTAASFGRHATAYLESSVHRAGDDLDQLGEWCASAHRGLDIATGAGHTAGALLESGVERVVAYDAAPEMVETAVTAVPDADGVVGDAESLPFADGAFDAVTCRIAAHHFPEPTAFLAEVARVLEPGGTFAFEDNVAPADDTLDAYLNTIERLRDPTHVRSHSVEEWLEWLEAAGFTVETARVVKKTLDYEEWIETQAPPTETRERLADLFAGPPPGGEELFEISRSDEGMESFANLKLLVRATR